MSRPCYRTTCDAFGLRSCPAEPGRDTRRHRRSTQLIGWVSGPDWFEEFVAPTDAAMEPGRRSHARGSEADRALSHA